MLVIYSAIFLFGIQEDQLLGFLDTEFQWFPIQKTQTHLTKYPNRQFLQT